MRKKLSAILLIIVISTIQLTAHAGYNKENINNFFDNDDTVENFNNERVLEDALDAQIALLEKAFISTQQKIANEYIMVFNGYTGLHLFGTSNKLTGEETMGIYDVELTKRSIEIAMLEAGTMDYAFMLSALSLLDEFQYGSFVYKDLKKYINSESISEYLCDYYIEEAYGIMQEDGTIKDVTSDTDGAKIYIKTHMQPCSVKAVFEMLNLNPDAYSTQIPTMTNYEVAQMRKKALKDTYAKYYDFGTSNIDYTIDFNYKRALLSDLNKDNRSLNIPLYHQEDYPKSAYGSSTVAKAGCGPTSMAMIVSYFTNMRITPDMIAKEYGKYYVNGKGSSHGLFSNVAKDYNIYCKQLKMNAQVIIDEITKGHPVIITVGPGDFTKGGHIMVIKGITENGEFILNDPNGYNYKKYKTDSFSINMVMLNASNGHAYSFAKE